MPTVNEKLQNESIAHSLFLSRYATGVAREMVKVLNEADSELYARLLVELEKVNPNDVTVKMLRGKLKGVREVNRQAILGTFETLTDELLAFAEHETDYQYTLFNTLLPDPTLKHLSIERVSAEQAYSAAISKPFQGNLLSGWASNIEEDRLTRIINTVKAGFLAGDDIETIARKVRGTKAANYKDGILESGRRNVTSVTKTAVNHLAAVARNKMAQNNSDIIECKQWDSTLDNKTSHWCIVRDGKRYTLDGQPIGHDIPYLGGPGRIHFCCRSTELLITKSWRELGIDMDELDEGTRASMDGQVPAKLTYMEWLQKQSFYRQTQVLGIMRARLLRDGGITVSEMFTDKGEFISLKQLKEIDSRAFEATGL